mgnify:CR=1 FL=1
MNHDNNQIGKCGVREKQDRSRGWKCGRRLHIRLLRDVRRQPSDPQKHAWIPRSLAANQLPVMPLENRDKYGCPNCHGEGLNDMRCPVCGHEIEAQQNRAAKSRWSNTTKAERAAEMSRIRKKGVKNQKRTARRSNSMIKPQSQ